MIDDSHSDFSDRSTVLCIDDDPQISEAIALRLRQYDVEVLRAFHATHGLWLAMTCWPDLTITDICMPQGGGSYVMECLRHNPATHDIPIIVLTGHRDPQLEASARQLGIEDFLTKPVRFDDLRAAIQKVIPLHEPDCRECDGGF
jgi:DNA-binding response OmpR family regulator